MATVAQELVFDYDVFQPGLPGCDILEGLFKLKRGQPPVFLRWLVDQP